jgi:hypothetical protein
LDRYSVFFPEISVLNFAHLRLVRSQIPSRSSAHLCTLAHYRILPTAIAQPLSLVHLLIFALLPTITSFQPLLPNLSLGHLLIFALLPTITSFQPLLPNLSPVHLLIFALLPTITSFQPLLHNLSPVRAPTFSPTVHLCAATGWARRTWTHRSQRSRTSS